MSRIPCWTILSSLAPRCALFAGLAVCAQHAGPARVRVIHAKAGATGTNNRHSGADAYTDLRAALGLQSVAQRRGGGMYNCSSSPTMSSPTVATRTFGGNTATYS